MSIHMCYRCGKVFKRKLHLEKHMKRKIPCKYVNLDDEDEVNRTILIDTDELVLDDNETNFQELEQWDPSQIEADNNYAVLFCAIRRSGKSVFIKHLYPQIKEQHDVVYFISNSIHHSQYSYIKDDVVFEDQHAGLFKAILKFQKWSSNFLKIAVVLDDCISLKNKNDNELLQLFTRGRNSNISVYLSSQSRAMINKNSRQNSDFVAIGNCPSAETREDIIKTFLNGLIKIPNHIKTKSQKIEYMDKFVLHYTKDYQFIICNNMDRRLYGWKTPI